MKILVACEESQEVCKAFREKGHEAYSCDIQIGDSKLDAPLTSKTYLADSGCGVDDYEDCDIYALIPRIDKLEA